MAFQLAEAYVQLSEKGEATLLTRIGSIESRLGNVIDIADGPMVAAFKKAADEMGVMSNQTQAFFDTVKQATEPVATQAIDLIDQIKVKLASLDSKDINIVDHQGLSEAVEALNFMSDQAERLDQIDLIFLRQLNETLPEIIKHAKELNSINEAFAKADQKAKPLKKTVKQLNQEIKDAKANSDWTINMNPDLTDIRSKFSDIFETIKQTKEELAGANEKVKSWDASMASTSGKFGDVLLKAGRLVGVVAAVGTAAAAVYNWVYQWSLAATGFNTQQEKSLELTKQIAGLRKKATDEAIAGAEKIVATTEREAELQRLAAIAKRDNDIKQKALKEADAARTPGFFGQFSDGKLNEELENDFKRAKIEADATADAVSRVNSELKKTTGSRENKTSQFAEKLKEERILLEQSELALRKYQLTKSLGKDGAKFAEEEASLKALAELRNEAAQKAGEEKQTQERISDAYKRQVDQLRLKYIELTKGAEAAAQERDKMAKFDPKQRAELSELRKKNKLIEEADKARKKQEKDIERLKRKSESAQKKVDADKKDTGGFSLSSVADFGNQIQAALSSSKNEQANIEAAEAAKELLRRAEQGFKMKSENITKLDNVPVQFGAQQQNEAPVT